MSSQAPPRTAVQELVGICTGRKKRRNNAAMTRATGLATNAARMDCKHDLYDLCWFGLPSSVPPARSKAVAPSSSKVPEYEVQARTSLWSRTRRAKSVTLQTPHYTFVRHVGVLMCHTASLHRLSRVCRGAGVEEESNCRLTSSLA